MYIEAFSKIIVELFASGWNCMQAFSNHLASIKQALRKHLANII